MNVILKPSSPAALEEILNIILPTEMSSTSVKQKSLLIPSLVLLLKLSIKSNFLLFCNLGTELMKKLMILSGFCRDRGISISFL